MAVLYFPDIPIAQVRWGQTSNTQTSKSPLDGSAQTRELIGAAWTAELAFKSLTTRDQRKLAAFLVKLRGSAGRFYFHDPTLPENQGSMLGNPVVDLAVSNTKAAIGSSGWTPNASGVLLAGDMTGFNNNELKMVADDVDADASGNAIINVEPPFRFIPTDATGIITVKPTCIMRLVDDQQSGWLTRPPLKSDFSINCVESWT